MEWEEESGLHSASLLIDELVKVHDLEVSVTFAEATALNKVREVDGLSKFVNKLVGLLGIFLHSELVKVEEVL